MEVAMSLPTFRSSVRFLTDLTRKELIELITEKEMPYHGEVDEIEFLARIYDLDKMPSTDSRKEYNTCRKDIIQHTINNEDWGKNWVFSDSRFELQTGPDEVLLRFLAETLHPVVRKHEVANQLSQQYNELLRADGWHLLPVREISGRPVYGGVPFAADGAIVFGAAHSIRQRLDSPYLGIQITRLQQALQGDPELAIGTAKEFLESVTKTVLQAKGEAWNSSDSFPSLVKSALKLVNVVPAGISRKAETEQSLKVLINNLGSSVDKLAELRNWHGTGHGKHAAGTDNEGTLGHHHAKFVVGIAVQIAQFIYDCLEAEGVRAPEVVAFDAAFSAVPPAEYDPFADE